ncbi:hypothetical protein [Geobacter benzoatilyticus]|jgi:hypothetical protein|nr:hypothetical protein [Geobacter benzoatilyticus]
MEKEPCNKRAPLCCRFFGRFSKKPATKIFLVLLKNHKKQDVE